VFIVFSSTDCDLNEAYITRAWLADSRHRDAALDATFRSLKQLLWCRAGLRGWGNGEIAPGPPLQGGLRDDIDLFLSIIFA